MKKLLYFTLLVILTSCGSDNGPDTDPINMTITPKVGVGDITFASSTGNDVVAQNGTYNSINAAGSPDGINFTIWYDATGVAYQLDTIDRAGLSLQEVVDMADELVDLNQEIVQMVIRPPFTGETTEGIKLGSTKAAVVAAFGPADDIFNSYQQYDDLNMLIWYSATDSTVTRIDLRK